MSASTDSAFQQFPSREPYQHNAGGLGSLQVSGEIDREIDLSEVWKAFRRRKKIIGVVSGSIITAAVLIVTHQRIFNPVFLGSFTLLITDPISNGSKSVSADNGALYADLAINTTNTDIPTLIELLKSPLLLNPIAESFQLNSNVLSRRINISTVGSTRNGAAGVLKVNLMSRNPLADQALLEAISQTYLEASLKQRQQRVTDGIGFLNKQAPSLQAKVDAIQSELAEFRREYSLLEPSTEGAVLKQRQAELSEQILSLEAERSRLVRVRKEIANGNLSARGFQEAIGTGDAFGSRGQGLAVSDADQSLLEQLIQVETELAEARSTYQPTSSTVLSLQARLNTLQPLLRSHQLEAVDAALNLNFGRLVTARDQEAALKQEFLQKPELIKQYESLQSQLTLAQDNLAGLVSARETFQLESAQQSVPWRIISPPKINLNPIKPSVPRYLAFGTLLGIVTGTGAGLLRDRLDHVFHNPRDVKDDLGLPLLGTVPHVEFFDGVRNEKRFILEELDNSGVAKNDPFEDGRQGKHNHYEESFRNLFTSLRFLNSDNPLKVIAITSSLLGEGKSLVNVLLAKTLSEMGQRVLLIDADLRKPQLHSRLGLNNLNGLTNLLANDSQSWHNLVQQVPGHNDWYVITAGSRSPDPARLLSSKRMQNFVSEISDSGEFDLILFDTPPVLGLADTALVAEHCDGVILLVSLDLVDRGLPKEAANRVILSGAPLLGAVTNAIMHEVSFSSYGYAYNYAYNYGYYINDTRGQGSSLESNEQNKKEVISLRSRISKGIRAFLRWIDN